VHLSLPAHVAKFDLQKPDKFFLVSVMQVVFAVAPQPLLEEFYSSFLSGDLPALAAHPSANFALQAFLAAANRSPLVKTLLAELKGSFKELLQRRRSGVVAALLAACARTSAGQADASKAIAAALTGLHDEGKVSNCAVLRAELQCIDWVFLNLQTRDSLPCCIWRSTRLPGGGSHG